jgi:hypothetical protein
MTDYGRRRYPKRPRLNETQERKFYELVARMASSVDFQMELGLDLRDVQYYMRSLQIGNADDARLRLRAVEKSKPVRKPRITKEIEDKNKRLQEQVTKAMEKKERAKKPDLKEVRRKEREAQARLDKKNKQSVSEWRLPNLSNNEEVNKALINTFENDIKKGLQFCKKKYNATNKDIKAEAARLNLVINWDMIPR